MQAIRVREFGEADVLKIEETAEPVPGPGQVRVRLHAAGVNPVDTYIRAGHYARLPALPYTPGLDGAGVVDAVGDGVTLVAVGQRVYLAGSLTGTYAEHGVCLESQVHPLPDGISFPQGAALGVAAATAWRALFQKGGATKGQCVLVHGGTGGVGSCAVQLARAAGLVVTATGGSPAGRERLVQAGAQHVLDHGGDDFVKDALASTGGRGFDLIVEMLANVNLPADLALVAPRGRIVIVGNRGTVEVDPRHLMAREATLVGLMLFQATPEELRDIHRGLETALGSGALEPVVGCEMPLVEAPAAHRRVMGSAAHGKVVLTM